MPNFEKNITTTEQENLEPPMENQAEQIPTLEELGNNFTKQSQDEAEAIGNINQTLQTIEKLNDDEISPENQQEISGIISQLAEKLQKSNLLKAATLAGSIFMATPAFGGELTSVANGKNFKPSKLSHSKMEHVINSRQILKGRYAIKDGRLVKNPNFKEKNTVDSRLGDLTGAKMNNPFEVKGTVIPTNKYNNLQQKMLQERNYLPGDITVNGERVYEIAPGVYGNEHSQYGNGMHIGTIEINN